jgi:hypothetical protein
MHMPKPCTIEILFDWIITNALKGENNDERRDEYRTLQNQQAGPMEVEPAQSGVIWFTGLSGSGKSALANEMDKRFYQMGIHSCLLDGDALRFGLNKDLGFSRDDRIKKIRMNRLFYRCINKWKTCFFQTKYDVRWTRSGTSMMNGLRIIRTVFHFDFTYWFQCAGNHSGTGASESRSRFFRRRLSQSGGASGIRTRHPICQGSGCRLDHGRCVRLPQSTGKTVYDALLELFGTYEFHKEGLHSLTFKGKEGMHKIGNIMTLFRSRPLTEVAGKK